MEAVKNCLFADDLTLQKPYTPSKKQKKKKPVRAINKFVKLQDIKISTQKLIVLCTNNELLERGIINCCKKKIIYNSTRKNKII